MKIVRILSYEKCSNFAIWKLFEYFHMKIVWILPYENCLNFAIWKLFEFCHMKIVWILPYENCLIKVIRPQFLQDILDINSLISLQENKMTSHHSTVGYTSGYRQIQEWPSAEFVASFHYPFSKPQLLQKWITFTDRKDWTLNSFQRDVWEHFHEDAMSRGLQRVNPIPAKKGPHCGKRQLNEPNIELWGKPL